MPECSSTAFTAPRATNRSGARDDGAQVEARAFASFDTITEVPREAAHGVAVSVSCGQRLRVAQWSQSVVERLRPKPR